MIKEIVFTNQIHGRCQIKHDILSRFIELGEDPESYLTDKSLRDVVLDFVIAGRDTTATTLSWAKYTVMTPNHVAKKLYSELKTFEEDRGRKRMLSCFR
jgi:cytochrome P450